MSEPYPFQFMYSLYAPDARDRSIFGERYDPPGEFRHGEAHRVAAYPKDPEDGDGQPVEVYETRLPARFYELRALPSTNSVGEPKPGWTLSTGSGDEMGELVAALAVAVTQGMVGVACGQE